MQYSLISRLQSNTAIMCNNLQFYQNKSAKIKYIWTPPNSVVTAAVQTTRRYASKRMAAKLRKTTCCLGLYKVNNFSMSSMQLPYGLRSCPVPSLGDDIFCIFLNEVLLLLLNNPRKPGLNKLGYL